MLDPLLIKPTVDGTSVHDVDLALSITSKADEVKQEEPELDVDILETLGHLKQHLCSNPDFSELPSFGIVVVGHSMGKCL